MGRIAREPVRSRSRPRARQPEPGTYRLTKCSRPGGDLHARRERFGEHERWRNAWDRQPNKIGETGPTLPPIQGPKDSSDSRAVSCGLRLLAVAKQSRLIYPSSFTAIYLAVAPPGRG